MLAISFRVLSILRILAARIFVLVPGSPFLVCLALRIAEGWKFWHEISRVTALGITVWLWTFLYMYAGIVTIFRLDDERSLRRWQLVTEAGNIVIGAWLAIKCAEQPLRLLNHTIAYPLRLAGWLAFCIAAQVGVNFAARRARSVSRRLSRRMKPKAPKKPPTGVGADLVACRDSLPATSVAAAVDETKEHTDGIVV